MRTAERQELTGSPTEIAETLAQLSSDIPSYEHALNEQLRELAIKLATHQYLSVFVNVYENGSQELEVWLTDDTSADPVMISRDHTGRKCQISYEPWMSISGQAAVIKVVDIVNLLLRVSNSGGTNAPARVQSGGARMRAGQTIQ